MVHLVEHGWLSRIESAGIELRLTTSSWPWWRAVVASSPEFSGIRLRHARPAAGPRT